MTQAKYLRDDLPSLLGHVVEECGEILAAIGKSQRWGLDSSNPELPPDDKEPNRAWVLREMGDLEIALARLRAGMCGGGMPTAMAGIGGVLSFRIGHCDLCAARHCFMLPHEAAEPRPCWHMAARRQVGKPPEVWCEPCGMWRAVETPVEDAAEPHP